MPGPTRKPGSVRWNRELRKKQKLAGVPPTRTPRTSATEKPANFTPDELPTCPECLPQAVQGAWGGLVMDALAAGVSVKQVDSRAFVVAAGQEVDLYYLEGCSSDDTPIETRLAVIGRKEQVRKSFLSSLVAIGGTPLARLRARIAPEDKPKADADPWGTL